MARERAYEDVGPTGRMHVMAMEFTYLDDGTAFEFPELPANCMLDRMSLQVCEVFDSGTNDLLDVGDGTTPNAYSPNSETDLRSSTGYQTMAGAGGTGVPVLLATATTITGTYASTGTAPTTGRATLSVHYYQLNV
jgi:hypothetical protein